MYTGSRLFITMLLFVYWCYSVFYADAVKTDKQHWNMNHIIISTKIIKASRYTNMFGASLIWSFNGGTTKRVIDEHCFI